jgi:uncharacterized protein
MQIFEPHIHMYSRTVDDYVRMASGGIKVIVEPSFWLGSDRRFSETFLDYFQHMLEFEPQRAARHGITHYTCIAVNPKEANNLPLARETINSFIPYLDHPRCVAIGEVGLDKNTDKEEEVLRLQLRIAKDRKMPVVVHTPHVDKKVGAERIVRVLREEGLDTDLVLIDHNTEDTIELSLDYGAWSGMTIYPGKIDPGRAIALMKKYGTDKLMINSSADWGVSDPTSVPQTYVKMQEAGFAESEIAKVVWDNPYKFYAQSGKLNL